MKKTSNLRILYLGLCLSSLAGAQAGTTLLVKTDASCNWKLDGKPMAPLKTDDATVVLVSPGEHLIEAAATEGVATLRTNVKVDTLEKTVAIQLKGRHDQQSKMLAPEPLGKLTVAEAAQNPTWTDPATGLMWTGKDNGSDVDWPRATAYCSKLQYAGYSGWRLPTTEELEGIHDLSVKSQKTYGNGVTYDVRVKGNLDLTGNQWSGTQGQNLGKPYETSWQFSFADETHSSGLPNPFLNFTHFSYDMRALCVRSAGNGVIDR